MVIDYRLIAKMLAPALFFFGMVGLIPATYANFNDARGISSFMSAAVIGFSLSLICKVIGNKSTQAPSLRVLFLYTTSLWVLVSLIAAIPFYMEMEELNMYQALFESCSSLSTTGSTVISDLDNTPHSILLWRAILQYFGGVGFVALAVIILPVSSMGGMSIFKTESSSFDDSAKFTPHLKTMVIYLFTWYISILIVTTLIFFLHGFTLFDAVTYSMSTVSTGGMAPHNSSMNGTAASLQYAVIVVMFISSCPFLLILTSLSGNPRAFFKDQQVRGYLVINLFIALLVALSLIYMNNYGVEKAFRIALFNVVAITSTTGFNLGDFTLWNSFSSSLFLLILAIGGCSGSTSGGIKTFRLQICHSMFKTQLQKLLHPHIVSEPRFNGKNIDSRTLSSVITYLVSYILVASVSCVIACSLGLDLSDAVTATMSCLSNIGPAMGTTLNPSTDFSQVSNPLCVLFSINMILGRLEILPVLLCFTRMFYRQ